MRQIAVAFETTGPSPKAGHRISEIVMIAQENRKREGEPLRFSLVDGAFPNILGEIKAFVGNTAIVIHDASRWRRFLGAELRKIKRHGASQLMGNVIDVKAWAHQRFPRQRRDVTSIAKRMGIETKMDLTGLEREAELLRLIAAGMKTSAMDETAKPIAINPSAVPPSQAVGEFPAVPFAVVKRNWVERIGCFWRMLKGKM